MSNKTREVIWGGRIMGAKMRAETARQEAKKAARAADRAEAEARSYGGSAQPSPRLANASARRDLSEVRHDHSDPAQAHCADRPSPSA
jgi:hypothetical protein